MRAGGTFSQAVLFQAYYLFSFSQGQKNGAACCIFRYSPYICNAFEKGPGISKFYSGKTSESP